MSFYPPDIDRRFRLPKNAGDIRNPAAIGTAGAPSCGALVRLSLAIDPVDHVIRDVKFRSSGCGFAIAASSLLTEMLIGITVPEAATLLASQSAWTTLATEQLGEFPSGRHHCSILPVDALAAAFSNYQSTYREHTPGEEALICTCFFVSERTIEKAIRDHDLTTTAEVTRNCRAGGGCGSCHPLIADILDSAKRHSFEVDHDLFG